MMLGGILSWKSVLSEDIIIPDIPTVPFWDNPSQTQESALRLGPNQQNWKLVLILGSDVISDGFPENRSSGIFNPSGDDLIGVGSALVRSFPAVFGADCYR